jgi:hypothetical protein
MSDAGLRDLWLSAETETETSASNGAVAAITIAAKSNLRGVIGWIVVGIDTTGEDMDDLTVRETDDSGTILARIGPIKLSTGGQQQFMFDFVPLTGKNTAIWIGADAPAGGKALLNVCYNWIP